MLDWMKGAAMVEFKAYLRCFLIAAVLCSAALPSAGASFSPGPRDGTNPSLRQDPDFIKIEPIFEYLEASYKTNRGVYAGSFHQCKSRAIADGVDGFRYYLGSCTIFTISYPLCKRWAGYYRDTYIRPELYTDGSPSDNATMSPASVAQYVKGPDSHYFRIDSPTIFDFRGYYQPRGIRTQTDKQDTIILADGHFAWKNPSILTDPSCYSANTCGFIFVSPTPEIPADELLILHDICGQNFQVDSGKSLYVLSHTGIGCKKFPNDYPVADCWAEFTGAGEIKIKVTLVNFRESDQCDGFTLTAVTDDASGSSASTDLCDASAPTELTSAGGKVRFEFGGSSSAMREKYGFNIQVTAA